MKLRLHEQSLRFRLDKNDLKQFKEHGMLNAKITFPGGQQLEYSLIADPHTMHLEASFTHQRVTVSIPQATVHNWIENDEISLQESLSVEGQADLKLLIEKDFQRLHRVMEGEQDPGRFSNPNRK
jgi:hypothetical protein